MLVQKKPFIAKPASRPAMAIWSTQQCYNVFIVLLSNAGWKVRATYFIQKAVRMHTANTLTQNLNSGFYLKIIEYFKMMIYLMMHFCLPNHWKIQTICFNKFLNSTYE